MPSTSSDLYLLPALLALLKQDPRNGPYYDHWLLDDLVYFLNLPPYSFDDTITASQLHRLLQTMVDDYDHPVCRHLNGGYWHAECDYGMRNFNAQGHWVSIPSPPLSPCKHFKTYFGISHEEGLLQQVSKLAEQQQKQCENVNVAFAQISLAGTKRKRTPQSAPFQSVKTQKLATPVATATTPAVAAPVIAISAAAADAANQKSIYDLLAMEDY